MRYRNALSGAFLLVVLGCSEEPSQQAASKSVAVVAQKLRFLPERVQVEAVGTAHAATSAEIFPEAAGLVMAVNFRAGDHVRRGTPLVELDARRERLAVELARVAAREAEQLLARYRRIEDTGALSASQIEAGETALASARLELEQAQVALADRTVRAPFSGHVGLTTVDPGDRITSTTRITQLDDRSTLYVDFAAPESVFARLRPGDTVQVTPYADPGRTIPAKVRAVDSTVTPEERTFIVRTAVDNRGDRLRPGMSFRVLFEDFGRSRPAVPEAAIVWGGSGAYLWAVRDGKAQREPLTIVQRRDGLVLVDANVGSSELVIAKGVQKVRQGQTVRLVSDSTPAAVQATVPVAGRRDGSDG